MTTTAGAARSPFPTRAFVAGGWRDAARTYTVTNPATGAALAEVADCGAEEARRAADAAVAAFPAWKTAPGSERGRILRRWFELMRERSEDLARTMSLEMGKPITETRGEVKYAASFVDHYAEEARRL